MLHNPQENWKNNTEIRKSTYFMRESSFLRCTSIEVAYNVPQDFLSKIKMQNVKFYARVNNPFLISSFKIWDVELGDSGSTTRFSVLGQSDLNIKFLI